jgi:altronate hydrolase
LNTRKTIKIDPSDNVLVALADLKKGECVYDNGNSIQILEPIAAKHKLTTTNLRRGDPVYLYGVLVGTVNCDVPAGTLIHTHNLVHAANAYGNRQNSATWIPPDIAAWQNAAFMGYLRPDGQVGIRNYWLIIPLVFCENRNILVLKDAFLHELGYAQPEVYRTFIRELVHQYQNSGHLNTPPPSPIIKKTSRLFPNIDGIKFLTHESGCGETRDDSETLCALLAGYCVNPNVAGITVLSLGCQHAQVSLFLSAIQKKDPGFSKPLLLFERQKWQTETGMLEEASRQTFAGLVQANQLQRQPAPLGQLVMGVKCGGSDGFSGISANPAVGFTADLLVSAGGTVVMAEFPELCGVEQQLINRCASDKIAQDFTSLLHEYAKRAAAIGATFDMNPSPGNIRDGLITDAIKSAGAAKKGGTSPIIAAIGYGGYIKKGGLNLLCTPGNDVLSTTAMAGAGASIQLFTTGLGTPTGNPVSPIVKIATNNTLANNMPDIIDYSCGAIITGEKTVENCGHELMDLLIKVASGEKHTAAELLGQDDFMFWKRGVAL